MAKKWIQKAIKKPGALHQQLDVPMGKKIPAKKLAVAAKKGGKLGKRAQLAKTLKSFHKGRGKMYRHTKKRNPFGDLGKDETSGPTRFSHLETQGKRLTGQTLLKKAMGALARK